MLSTHDSLNPWLKMNHPDKSVLLEQINAAIEKGSSKDISKLIEEVRTNQGSKNAKIVKYRGYISDTASAESIKKLQQRILALEDLNDNLLYFVNYLFLNLPDLVRDIVHNADGDVCKMQSSHSIPNTFDNAKQCHPVVTRREREVLQLLVEGLCAKQIATILFISETTVITHKKNLKIKFNSKNTVELVAKASAFLGEAAV